MKIEIVANIIDPEHGIFNPGTAEHPTIADVPDEVAADWLQRGLALPHKEQQVETATAGAPEKATGTRQRQDSGHPQGLTKETAAKT